MRTPEHDATALRGGRRSAAPANLVALLDADSLRCIAGPLTSTAAAPGGSLASGIEALLFGSLEGPLEPAGIP